MLQNPVTNLVNICDRINVEFELNVVTSIMYVYIMLVTALYEGFRLGYIMYYLSLLKCF